MQEKDRSLKRNVRNFLILGETGEKIRVGQSV
jgi:hypothetical protein